MGSSIVLTENRAVSLGFKYHEPIKEHLYLKLNSGYLIFDLEFKVMALSNSLREFSRGEYFEDINNRIKTVQQLKDFVFLIDNKKL